MGASAKTKQNSVSTYTPTPEAAALYSNIIKQAQSAQSAYNPATAQTVAGFTPDQLKAFSNIGTNQGIWQPNVNAAGEMVSGAGAGISDTDISKFYNPYQKDVIDTTMQQMRDQDALATRGYMANEVAQGGLGGNGIFLGKAQLAADQGKTRAATLANLNNTGWQQALAAAQADKSRGLTAGQTLAGIGQMQGQLSAADAAQLLNAGNQQQAQQQNVNNAASQNALNEQLWPMQQAQWLASIGAGIGPLTGGTTASQGTATQSQGKGAGNILGGALSLASMASDERVKEDVREVGTTHDGQPIYSFRYVGDPRTQMGLMAQDVERGEHPEAVSEIGGVKHVNYDRALADARRYANGGIALPSGLMGWSDLPAARPQWPDAPNVSAPSQQQDKFDPEAFVEMGKKAGAGLGKLFSGSPGPAASSPAGGSRAAAELQSPAAGGLGGLFSGLGSLFGFADGGFIPSDEEMDALEQVESGGRNILGPVTRSGERAVGPRQIMPSTARDPGFGVRPLAPGASVDEQRRFSNDYFAAMLKRYGGDRQAARIAYNGGPARADAWLKAGRDDSVIPQESADYYKKIESVLGGQAANLVAKAKEPAANSVGVGEPYASKADRAGGGMLKRAFGIDFNPLNLDESERRALLVAGLTMMSTGDIGKGGLAGMNYLSGVTAGERERMTEAQKLAYQMKKDADDLALRTRAEDRQAASEKRQGEQFGRTETRLEAKDAADQAWREGEAARKAAELTQDQKEYAQYEAQERAAGREPKTLQQYIIENKQAGRPVTNIDLGQKKGSEEMAKRYSERYFKLQDNATTAQGNLDMANEFERAAEGLNQGALGQTEQSLRRWGAALGIGDAGKAAKGDLANAISNKLALQLRAPGGESGGMPGAMSDADREFLSKSVPGLLLGADANRAMVATSRAIANRQIALAQLATDYAAEHDNQLDVGFDKVAREYVQKNPIRAEVEAALAKPAVPVQTPAAPQRMKWSPQMGIQ